MKGSNIEWTDNTAFLGAWAVHLEKQPPLQEREEKARLVAMLEEWR